MVFACLGCSEPEDEGDPETYYVVTHGPTTDVGFWGEVYEPALRRARELGVRLVPLHPATESTGAGLNAHMAAAVAARPAGIMATLWGDGMVDVVRRANAMAIPVAGINVYPDPAEYQGQETAADVPADPAKAGLLFYAGQDDTSAARELTRAIICRRGAGVLAQDDTLCADGATSIADAWSAWTDGRDVRTGCLVHQRVAPCFRRCAAFEEVVRGLGDASYQRVEWDASVAGAGAAAVGAFLDVPQNRDADLLLVMSCGPASTDALLDYDPRPPENLVYITFDTTPRVCDALADGVVALTSDQGHRLQARMALEYLYYYTHHGALPAPGSGPDGKPDMRWTSSEDFRVYLTGPRLVERPEDCGSP